MSGNRYNFATYSYNDIDISNLVDRKAVYYLVGASDMVIDSSSLSLKPFHERFIDPAFERVYHLGGNVDTKATVNPYCTSTSRRD